MPKKLPFNERTLQSMKGLWRLSRTEGAIMAGLRQKVEDANGFYKQITGLGRIEACQEEIRQLQATQRRQQERCNYLSSMVTRTEGRLEGAREEVGKVDRRREPGRYFEALAKETQISEELLELQRKLKLQEQQKHETFDVLGDISLHHSEYQHTRGEYLRYLRYLAGGIGLLVSTLFFNDTRTILKAIGNIDSKVEEIKKQAGGEQQGRSYGSYVSAGASSTWGGIKWVAKSPYSLTKWIWGSQPEVKKSWWRPW